MRHAFRVAPVAVALSLLMAAGALHAQVVDPREAGFLDFTHWAIGYTVNAPNQMVGFSTVVFSPRLGNWGLYADYKRALEAPMAGDAYMPSLTIGRAENEFNDRLVDSASDWTSFNAALVRAVTGTFAVYAGADYSKEKAYRQYFDTGRERGSSASIGPTTRRTRGPAPISSRVPGSAQRPGSCFSSVWSPRRAALRLARRLSCRFSSDRNGRAPEARCRSAPVLATADLYRGAPSRTRRVQRRTGAIDV